jgi:membrane carboxypeptidase/penicillin-binding protein PbpC
MDKVLFWMRDAVTLLRSNGSTMHATNVDRGAALLEMALKMREAQRVYYKTKKREALIEAKRLEVEFDKAAL